MTEEIADLQILTFITSSPTVNLNDKQVREKLQTFQGLKAGTPEFIPPLEPLMDDLAHHIKEEEVADLPALGSILCRDESERLTKSFSRTKAFVPSRSHPLAPDKPPFETMAGLVAAPLEHLGDLLGVNIIHSSSGRNREKDGGCSLHKEPVSGLG